MRAGPPLLHADFAHVDCEPFQSGSPESLNGQMLRNVGVGGRVGVRVSMSGIHYCRAAWEKAQPTHRFSWMKPERDEWFGRDPSSFLSSSSSPSSVPPLHRHELAYLLHSRPSPSLLAISSPLPLPPVLDLTNDAPVTVDVQAIVDLIPHDPSNPSNPLGLPPSLLSLSLPSTPSSAPSTPPSTPSSPSSPTLSSPVPDGATSNVRIV